MTATDTHRIELLLAEAATGNERASSIEVCVMDARRSCEPLTRDWWIERAASHAWGFRRPATW